jgi:hypothetical protein
VVGADVNFFYLTQYFLRNHAADSFSFSCLSSVLCPLSSVLRHFYGIKNFRDDVICR